MQLPGPVRAAVGLVASAADNAKHLPDRAIELPMLAVSTALQVSLRAQQRYARLTARGDQALSRRRTGDEPPEWATFDDPVPSDQRHARPGARAGASATAAARLLDELLAETGPSDPGENGAGPAQAPNDTAAPAEADPPPAAPKSTADTASKAAAKKPAAAAGPAKRTTSARATTRTSSTRTNTTRAGDGAGKGVSKPRHTAPSRFDEVGDSAPEPATDTDRD